MCNSCCKTIINELCRSSNLKAGFKKPGKNGLNIFRAIMITGPPGIGKTTSAHLCAKLAGFTPIELNASDARSKKLVEVRFLYLVCRIRFIYLSIAIEWNKYQQHLLRWLDGRGRSRSSLNDLPVRFDDNILY